MKPLVSILIPTYNRSHFLYSAIRSALNQTYAEIEVVVLDDCSPDDTKIVVGQFRDDPRFNYVRHEKNKGIAGNWREGINLAKGQFFCFLHDDDTFEPTFVDSLLAPLVAHESVILASCDHWVTDESGNKSISESDKNTRRFKRDTLPEGIVADFAYAALIDGSLPIGSTLFKKQFVTSNFVDERAKGAIDAWLFFKCVQTGMESYYVNKRLMNYRDHAGGMSVSMPLYMAEGHLFRFENILTDPNLTSIHDITLSKKADTLCDLGIGVLSCGKNIEARRYIRMSWKIRKTARALTVYLLSFDSYFGKWYVKIIRKMTQQFYKMKKNAH